MAGKRGICPTCETKIVIPLQSVAESQPTPGGDEDSTDDLQLGGIPKTANAAVMQAASVPAGLPRPEPVVPRQVGSSAAPGLGTKGSMPPAPLHGAEHAQWYVRHANGQQYGPAVGEIFHKWIAEGRVPGNALIWREGWAEWLSAAVVFPQLAPQRMLSPAEDVPGTGFSVGSAGVAAFPSQGLPMGQQRMPDRAAYTAPRQIYPPAAVVQNSLGGPGFQGTPGSQSGGNRTNDPLDFASEDRSGMTSNYTYRRKDNSQFVMLVSILLMLAIAILGCILAYVISMPRAESESPSKSSTAVFRQGSASNCG
jgi:hypothetical protein